jgi:hypothetical protein
MKPEVRKIPYGDGMLVIVVAQGAIEWRGGTPYTGDNTMRIVRGREPVSFRLFSDPEAEWVTVTNDFSEEDIIRSAKNNPYGFSVGI